MAWESPGDFACNIVNKVIFSTALALFRQTLASLVFRISGFFITLTFQKAALTHLASLIPLQCNFGFYFAPKAIVPLSAHF